MPLYEYRCAKCGQVMEVLERPNQKAQHTCDKCGSRNMEKLISSFAVGTGTRQSGGSCPTGTCPLG